jgi:hypothetical protein
MDALGCYDEDLLSHLFGQIMPDADKRDAEPVHRVEVPLEQLPPRLLAACLRRVYRKRLGLVRQVGIPVY